MIRANEFVAVVDGRKAIFLRNGNDALYPNLVVIESRSQDLAPDRDLQTDRPGRVHQSAASFRSSVEVVDRHEQAEDEFIAAAAKRLEEWVATAKNASVIVVSPPRALGVLRRAYSPALRAAVRVELDHDWVHLPTGEIESRLAKA